jgi:thioredoxin-related protein
MKKISLFLLLITSSIFVYGQKDHVKWYTIEEAQKLVKENPRPLIIDTFTDWCGWCKKLDEDTFSNKVICNILNTRFYPVKFDAESSEPINFMGQPFINDGKSGRAHQFAAALLRGQLSYPNLVFFNEKLQLLTNVPGYQTPKEMEVLLVFIADKAYEKQNYQDFEKGFHGNVK